MDCVICLERQSLSGINCKTCKTSVCLHCETNLTKCPFCRTVWPKWFDRVLETPRTLEYRLQEEVLSIRTQSIRFKENKEILQSKLNGVILGLNDVRDFLGLFGEDTTEEQKTDWLIVVKEFMHHCIMESFPEEIIQLLTIVTDWLHNTIENYDILERFGILQEEIDEWDRTTREMEIREYHSSLKKVSKIENDFRRRAQRRRKFNNRRKLF